jgi:hypothetical protein
MEPVTKWERWIEPEDGQSPYWALNHLEPGHSDDGRPNPFRDRAGDVYKKQRHSWAKAAWRKSFGSLEGERHVLVGLEPVDDEAG